MSVIHVIQEKYEAMSKGRKKIATYILHNTQEASFLPAHEISLKVGVSESAVIRFAGYLGYSGYREMQEDLRRVLLETLDMTNRFNKHVEQKGSSKSYLAPVEQDLKNISETFCTIDEETLHSITNRILKARKIGIVALRGATAPALILQILLNEILNNVSLLTPGYGDVYDKLKSWNEEDLLIGFEFFPTKTFTYSVLKYAKEKGCQIIAIASNVSQTFLSQLADDLIQVKLESSIVSYTSAVVAVNVILHMVSSQLQEQTVLELKEVEKNLKILNPDLSLLE